MVPVVPVVSNTDTIKLPIARSLLNFNLTHYVGSKDFFNAEAAPTAKFVADKIGFAGDKVNTVAGSLTLLGKTLPVVLTALHFNCYDSPMLKREVCGADASATFNRNDFGVSYGTQMGFSPEVKLAIQVEAVKQ